MYESFFALDEKPFSLTPNPRFLFLSNTHNEVYAHLLFGIENRAGFVEVTGEIGTGKTTILRTLLSHLDEDKYRVAFIFNPKLTAYELLKNINQEFGVDDGGDTSPDLIQAFNTFLLSENEAGRTPILVIDEAQNLSGEVLEQIRLLSNLETETDKLIQVILVGQPELRTQLSDHSLRQLNQRIAVRYQLRPLSSEETQSYVLHRLKIAGRPDSNVFSSAALKKVYKLSGGVPRLINLICDRAMLTAFTEERGVVSAMDVEQAAREIDGTYKARSIATSLSVTKLVLFAVLAVCLVAGFYIYSQPVKPKAENVIVEQPSNPVVENQPVTENKSQDSPTKSAIKHNSLVEGFNALLSLWGVNEHLPDNSRSIDIDSEFEKRGFEVARFSGSLEHLETFNVPVLMPVKGPDGIDYLSVSGSAGPDLWTIVPELNGRKVLGGQELDQIGLQTAIVPWIDFANIGFVAVPGNQGENIRRLQFLLGLTGCTGVPTDGVYSTSTIDCVKEFQRDHGLTVDGLVGSRTLILLYQFAGGYNVPQLK